MRSWLLCVVALATLGGGPAVAQSSFMPDVIGQTVANSMANPGNPDKCYDGRWQPKEQDVTTGRQRAEIALQAYLNLAASGSPPFLKLAFFSASAEKQPAPVKPFCFAPGDIETWTEVKAKRAADKAAKQAARENAR